ncbi:MAG: nitric oxide synthase oxygenase [Kineosporiaceae bacterium]
MADLARAPQHVATPISALFEPTPALAHDSSHCLLSHPGHTACPVVARGAVDPERAAADWAVMYHWLGNDPAMAVTCCFDDADLTPIARSRRIGEIRREIAARGVFDVTQPEMQFWVRYAWTSADRCTGRQHAWQRTHVEVRHLPHVRTGPDMLRAVVKHAEIAMRSDLGPQTVVTVMGAPSPPGELEQLFVTEQLIRYADDPQYRGLVDWLDSRSPDLIQRPATPGPFTVLPMIAIGEAGDAAVGTPPPARHYSVPIPRPRHPDEIVGGARDGSLDMGFDFTEPFALWTAIPLQTNFSLDIAGQRYALAFNGWYVDEEIVIDLLDPARYDLADAVAAEIFHSPVARLDDYRVAQVEFAMLFAVRAGFQRARRRLTRLEASQSGFARFWENYLARHGENPPNDPTWTSNRMQSRYRRPSHSMPLVPQTQGARLVRHWLTHTSLRSDTRMRLVPLTS